MSYTSRFRYPFSQAGRVAALELARIIDDWAQRTISLEEASNKLDDFCPSSTDPGPQSPSSQTFTREMSIAKEEMRKTDLQANLDFDARRFAVARAIRTQSQGLVSRSHGHA